MTERAQWTVVDAGWGRRAADFAALSEPSNAREYVFVHQVLGVSAADRLLDVACGSGLAVELATARGAACSGIDASPRLVTVARDRVPAADLRVGDMRALPWDDASFDVVTSFRGIWGTTPDALDEVRRVLRPGGRMGITVWGHIKTSPGAWALQPFTLATPEQVTHMGDMVRLGRPGVGEQLLAERGFAEVVRHAVPFVWEFADPDHYARALAATGPAYEAIQRVGEDAFHAHACELAAARVRDGLPLRAEIAVVCYSATRPHDEARSTQDEPSGSFLATTPPSPAADRLRAEDLAELGYVMNATRLWGRMPEGMEQLFGLLGAAVDEGRLPPRERGVLVAACASALGDSYCSLAWGGKLAASADPGVAAGVLSGTDTDLTAAEAAMADWARRLVRDPNATTADDVERLRQCGLDDQRIFAITLFVALRLAFSTVNDALGARPDPELVASLPPQVRDAVTWGRPAAP